jgi:hypothetical protein
LWAHAHHATLASKDEGRKDRMPVVDLVKVLVWPALLSFVLWRLEPPVDVAARNALAFGRLLRDTWLAWPARVHPELAPAFDLDATALTVALEGYVREDLEQLARERPDF